MRSELTGLHISTSSPALGAAVDTLTGDLLRFGKDAGQFFAAIDLDPDCALAQALAAALHLFTMSRAGIEKALPLLAEARARAASATVRERLFVAAVDDWAHGRISAAIVRHRTILDRWPTDLLSLKLVTYHQLNRGEFADMLATVEAALPANCHVPYIHGIHAFALSQVGRYAEAEAAGRLGAASAADPWAQHAVAHVLDLAGAHADGAAFLAAHQGDWDSCSSFLYTHNWWHAALFRLALGDGAGALRLYDERVWTRRKDYFQDQINATALLARLELAGLDVGDRWSELADRVAPSAFDHLNGFTDLHYIVALARAGRDGAVADMLGSLAAWAESEDSGDTVRTTTHCIAAAGLAAWGRGDHGRAAPLLDAARHGVAQLGGSDVQRELFELILVDALRRSGAPVAAMRIEQSRRGRRAEAEWQRRTVASGCAPPTRSAA